MSNLELKVGRYKPVPLNGGTIAIVSQGPSAEEYPGHDGFAAVIGVSGVATKHECDYWAFSDWNTYGRWKSDIIGTPIIAVRGSQVLNKIAKMTLPDRQGFEREKVINVNLLDLPGFTTSDWNIYSGLTALGLAWSLKPSRVHCYGCDMTGTMDIHGHDGTRPPHRWQSERKVWDRMVDAMMRRDNIEVVRFGCAN